MRTFSRKFFVALVLTLFLLGSSAFRTNAQTTTPTASLNNVTVTDIQATIGGALTGGDLLSDVSVVYGTDPNSFPNQLPASHTASYFALCINNLTPSTKYYYRVVGDMLATSGLGATGLVLSTVDTFTTNASGKTDPTNQNHGGATNVSLYVVNATQTSATVKGRAPTASTAVEVQVDTTGNGTFDYKNTPAIKSDKTFEFNMTGLKPGHVYNIFMVLASDPSKALTTLQSFATLGISAAPFVSSVTDKTATISAHISDGATSPTVIYGTGSGDMNGKATLSPDSEGTYSAKLSDLTANTAYAYQIVGTENGKTVPYTNVYSFLTAQTAATPPTVPTISGAGTTATGAAQPFTLGSLVQCGVNGPLIDSNGNYSADGRQACSFEEVIKLISRIIDFLLFIIAPIILIVILTWGGFLILTSAGSTEKVTKAKGMFVKAISGFVIALCAWILVKFIMVSIGYNTDIFPAFYM